jgi:hypothetical protein
MAYHGARDKKVYLLTTNGMWWQRLTGFLDMRPEVLNWFMVFGGNAIPIASRADVTTLTRLIHEGLPDHWFILAEVDPLKTNGWVNEQVWDFLNAPKSSGRWEPPG